MGTQIGLALRDADIEAEFAASFTEALALLTADRFDAVVVDPQLGGGLGVSLCRAAARPNQGPATPVITLCAPHAWHLAALCRLAGARKSLFRPVGLERFLTAVWDLCGQAPPSAREFAQGI